MRRSCAAFLLALLAPSVAFADVFEVTYSAVIDPDPFPVFGVDAPTPLEVTFLVDTDAAPVVAMPDTAWNGPALYGYAASAITLPSITFGTATFTAFDLVPRTPVSGYEAVVWFDAPLAEGATPNTWMRLEQESDVMQFGGGQCGAVCELTAQALVEQAFIFPTSATGTLEVSVTKVESSPLGLTLPYAIPGEVSLLSVSGATPGKTVYFGVSRNAGNLCPALLGGQCLSLSRPTLLGQAQANARGDAWLPVEVPATYVPGNVLRFQAAMAAGVDSLVSEVVVVTAEAP